jgi:ribonuclease BN (tRNA processing enzyme)
MTFHTKSMSLTILGSGTCVPSLSRSSCSVLLKINGKCLLFDSGAGTMGRLLEAGTDIFDISYVFYSHFHPDHTGELVSFLFANKYPDGTRRTIPITFIAGNGFINFYNNLKKVYGNWINLAPGLVNTIELDTGGRDYRKFDDFTVESVPVNHSEESIAYKITGIKGKSIVYSGDTDFSDNLIKLAKNVDILICESALPDEMKVQGHLTPSLAGEIASRANVQKLILTHFYPECDQVDIEKQCRRTYSGSLVLARDLMTFKL